MTQYMRASYSPVLRMSVKSQKQKEMQNRNAKSHMLKREQKSQGLLVQVNSHGGPGRKLALRGA